jgi:hypothetical protein
MGENTSLNVLVPEMMPFRVPKSKAIRTSTVGKYSNRNPPFLHFANIKISRTHTTVCGKGAA